jgi:hypothetical protein
LLITLFQVQIYSSESSLIYVNIFFLLGYRKIAPTLLLDVPQDSAIMTGEIFGPLLPIVTVSDISLPS